MKNGWAEQFTAPDREPGQAGWADPCSQSIPVARVGWAEPCGPIGPAPLTYLLDRFTGPDATDLNGRALEVGGIWTIENVVSNYGMAIRDNKAYVHNWGSGWIGVAPEARALTPNPWYDFTLEMDCIPQDASGIGVRILLRYKDANNYAYVWQPANQHFRLYKVVGGVETLVAFTFPWGSITPVRIQVIGNTITATPAAGPILNATDPDFNTGGTLAGFHIKGDAFGNFNFMDYADNFLVWPGGGAPPPNPIYPFSLTSPVSYEVIQRAGAIGNIPVTGSIVAGSGAHDIEASFNGGAYQTIALNVTGAFSGVLTNQAQGQGILRVRFVDDPAIHEDVALTGEGDAFVISGQSNAAGGMFNGQVYTHPTLKAGIFGNDYRWHELADPTDSNAQQADMVSYDVNQAGSYWPLLATLHMADQGVPIAFVPCAIYACSITDWLPGADHEDRSTLYGSMIHRARQISGGVKAVLWHQGESDAANGMAQATYQAHMATIAAAVVADLGVKLMPAKIHHWAGAPATPPGQIDAINLAIDDEWVGDPNVLPGPDMSSPTEVAAGLHISSDAEGLDAAARWWAALQAAFGW